MAGILQGIAPGVQQTYSDAAQRQAAFAKGFSDHMQAAQAQRAGDTSSFLQNVVGAPSEQVGQVAAQTNPAAAGDTLYGLRGYIPASTLNEEGAAYTANARQLPAIAQAQGLQQIGKVQADQRAQDAKFGQDIATEAGKAPQYRQQIANDLFDQAYKSNAQKIATQKLIDGEASTKFDQTYKLSQAQATQAYRQTQIDFKNAGLKLASAKYNLDVQKLVAAGAKPNAALSKLYGHIVDANGGAIVGANGAPIKVKATNGAKPLTAAKIDQLKGDAAAIAGDAFNGFTDSKTNKKYPPLNFGQTLAEMRKGTGNGAVPLPIALKEMRQAGFKIPAKYGKIIGGAPGQGDPFDTSPGLVGPGLGDRSSAIVKTAASMLGTPYVWGGNSPGKALDCSSFVQQTYAKLGISLPRTTYAQVKAGTAVSLNELQPGDAVFTEPGKNGPNHVGLYIGNGMVQESPHTGDVNKIIALKDFLSGGFVAARRYIGG